MPQPFPTLLVANILSVFVGFALCGHAAAQPATTTAQDNPPVSQDAAVAALKSLGGQVAFDTKSPDRPATGVTLFGPHFTDAHLVHLKALTSLQSLDLTNSKVSDAGLVHLKGLHLKRLDLTYTRITGAGLAHVERLTSLETLALGYTKITDPRLEHLFALTKLQTLYLTNTKVTGAGVKELRRALPRCNTDLAN